jgi:hypothetical protein
MDDTNTVLSQRRSTPTMRTWLGLGAAAALVLAMIALIVAACLGPGLPMAGGAGPLPTPSGSAGSEDPGAGSGEDGSGPDGGGQDDAGGQPGQAPAPPPGSGNQPPGGPVIEVFRVIQQPQCPGGTTQHMIEGQPVGLEWTVTGADGDQVSLSVDGPGVYDTYPADGGDVINFPCEGEPGDIQEHTYLLTAAGDGHTTTRTLVVTATVQEVTSFED